MRKSIYEAEYRRLVGVLRGARRDAGLTQAVVGRRMGVSKHWVSKAESCGLRLDIGQFIRLCRVYGLQAHDLVRRLAGESP